MTQKFKIPSRIFFTGFMATGKSRLAELTAAALGYKFFDTDNLVVKKTDREVSQIFLEDGEEYFRKMELQVLEEVVHQEGAVISLGGGTLTQKKAVDLVLSTGYLIGLYADPETILERVSRKEDRPLLAGLSDEEKMQKIKSLLEARKDIYALAHFQIKSSNDIPHHVLVGDIIHRIELESLHPLRVNLSERSYDIFIHQDITALVKVAGKKWGIHEQVVIVTDTNLKEAQKNIIRDLSRTYEKCRVFYFKAGEWEKNLSSINRLISFLIKHQFDRKTTLFAFGGGVVGDMVGFTAAIYLRGIHFIQIPTTLLSMVDSSVGGKTGVNHKDGKNLIGAFYQPKGVIISLDVLGTLPQAEFLAGMAEIIKYACIWDQEFFLFLKNHKQQILNKDSDTLAHVVRRCCEIKAEIVSQDETETGVRALLNYGHTFGHALEALSGYHSLSHGFAVGLGMIVAARLAVSLGLLTPEAEKDQNELISMYGLPTKFAVKPQEAWKAMGHDKKVSEGKKVFILLSKIGSAQLVKDPPQALVDEAWKAIQPGKSL